MIEFIILAILLFIILVLLIMFVYYYNTIIVLSNRIDNAFSQIDVQLKRRNDLIPNLVATIKGYVKQEKGVIETITKARENMMKAGTIDQKMKASNQITDALKTIFSFAENYPDLKSNQNFSQLQQELSDIESKIAYTRQYYNDSVLTYNNQVTTFPGVLFANVFGKNQKQYLETPEQERKVTKVEF